MQSRVESKFPQMRFIQIFHFFDSGTENFLNAFTAHKLLRQCNFAGSVNDFILMFPLRILDINCVGKHNPKRSAMTANRFESDSLRKASDRNGYLMPRKRKP